MIGEEMTPMSCAICGCENVHICAVEVDQAIGKTLIGGKGTQVVPSDRREKNHRGSEVKIIFACESGCRYEERWEFSKGATYSDIRGDEISGYDALRDTLWRD